MGLYDGFIGEMEKDALSVEALGRRAFRFVARPVDDWLDIRRLKALQWKDAENFRAAEREIMWQWKDQRARQMLSGRSRPSYNPEYDERALRPEILSHWKNTQKARRVLREMARTSAEHARNTGRHADQFRPAAMKRILALSVGGAAALGAGGTGAALLLSRRSKDKE